MQQSQILLGMALLGAVACNSASGFVAEKAAVGTWTCKPDEADWLFPSEVVLEVADDGTFKVTTDSRPNNALDTTSGAVSGTWEVTDGSLAIGLLGEEGTVKDFENLDEGTNEVVSDLGLGSDALSIDVRSSSEFTIERVDGEPEESPWTCRRG